MNSKRIISSFTHIACTSMPYLAVSLLLIICISVTYVGYHIYKSAEDSAYKSCILSIRSALIKNIENNKQLVESISPTQEWKVLVKEEVHLLFKSLPTQRFDCKNYPDYKNGQTETGDSVQIAVRQINGRIDVTIEGIE